jgi:transposase
MPSPKALPIELTDVERERLTTWSRRRSSGQGLALRCRIVLGAASGMTNCAIAERLGVSRPMVTKWRSRFARERIDGLIDAPRPGRPRTVTDVKIEKVISRTLERPPGAARHWTTRSMAAEVGLTQSAVHRIWRVHGLQPRRQDTWKLFSNPGFAASGNHVAGLFLDPPERIAALCVSHSCPLQSADRAAPASAEAGENLERTVPNLGATLGMEASSSRSPRRAIELKGFLRTLNSNIGEGFDVYLVIDGARMHHGTTIAHWLVSHPRFIVHVAPTPSSWQQLVTLWLVQPLGQQRRPALGSCLHRLNRAIDAWIDIRAEPSSPFVWIRDPAETAEHLAG